MAPIRVGIIGLSAKEAAIVPGAWATVALLPSFTSSPEYEIVALCNSSVEAARRSIAMHKLPASTKAYGDFEQLAQDPDVDLVVVSVNVAQHHKLALPAIANNKQVYVEWPLGASLQEAEELTELMQSKAIKTIVGLQGRGDRCLAKVKEIIESGEIGQVMSTSLVGAGSGFFPGFWIEGAEYNLDMNSGGSTFHITFGHMLDSFTHVVGDFDLETIFSNLKNDGSEVQIRSMEGRVVNPAFHKTAPDHITVHGRLKNGALASLAYRTTPATVDDVGVRWIITGSKGEIEITSDRGIWQADSPNKKLRIRLLGEEQARDIDFRSGTDIGGLASVPATGVNTGLILDAFAKNDMTRFADFSSALKSHRLLEQVLKNSGYKY